MHETLFTITCTPYLHLKIHGSVADTIAGASQSINSFEPAQLPNPPVASTSSTACVSKQVTIVAAVERTIKFKPGSLRKRKIDASILKLVTSDLQPLTVVENQGLWKKKLVE